MEANVLTITKEKAQKELRDLKELFKLRGELKTDTVYRDLQRAYGHMKHGGKTVSPRRKRSLRKI